MTVVVGVAAPDGIVLAADSRTTSFPAGAAPDARHRIASDSTDKVFTIGDRFAVATYGDTFIGFKTIGGLMDEFIAQIRDEPPEDIDSFTARLGTFFHERYAAFLVEIGEEIDANDESVRIGFLVAGYDSEGIGHLKEVFVPGARIGPVDITTALTGLAPRGQTDVIDRLLAGVDWTALGSHARSFPQEVVEALSSIEYEIMFPITLQDAIDLATFLIRTTIDMQRFSDGVKNGGGGVPGCGGETRVVAVKRTDVEWVSRSALSVPSRIGRAEGSLRPS